MPAVHFIRLGVDDAIKSTGMTDDQAFADMQGTEGDAVVQVKPSFIGLNAEALIGRIYNRKTGKTRKPPQRKKG